MSHTVVLPALGESVTEGTVTRWLVEVGDTIEVDAPLVPALLHRLLPQLLRLPQLPLRLLRLLLLPQHPPLLPRLLLQAPRFCCPLWASPSPRAPLPAG